MIKEYFLNGRRQWKTYCSSCHALLGDTAPNEEHIKRDVLASGICPLCKGKIHDKEKDSLAAPRKTAE